MQIDDLDVSHLLSPSCFHRHRPLCPRHYQLDYSSTSIFYLLEYPKISLHELENNYK